MNLELGLVHRQVRETARRFAQNEAAPVARQYDEEGRFAGDLVGRMGELGFLGGPIPRPYGGAGLDYLVLVVTLEEVARADAGLASAITVHVGLNSLTLLQWGTEEQKRRFLPPQATGEKLACFGLTEPNAGTDVAATETIAVREGNGYRLNGTKTWITLAGVAEHLLIFATLDRGQRHRGLCAFIVERGCAGLSTEVIRGKMGFRLANEATVYLEDCVVPAENRLGEEGEGFAIAMSALDVGRLCSAAMAVGTAQACLDASIAYARQRETFGRPIGRRQLVQQMIANMVVGVEAARLLTYKAAAARNRGEPATREASLAKWFASDVAVQAALDAIQVHGAQGYASAFPVERHLRNAKAAQIYEGTNQVQQIMQAEFALGYRGVQPLRCMPPAPESVAGGSEVGFDVPSGDRSVRPSSAGCPRGLNMG